jgi:hypothetical protein
MPRKRTLFRQRDVARLLRAYRAADCPQPSIKVTKDGELVAIPIAPGETAANSWDEVLTNAEDAKRAS